MLFRFLSSLSAVVLLAGATSAQEHEKETIGFELDARLDEVYGRLGVRQIYQLNPEEETDLGAWYFCLHKNVLHFPGYLEAEDVNDSEYSSRTYAKMTNAGLEVFLKGDIAKSVKQVKFQISRRLSCAEQASSNGLKLEQMHLLPVVSIAGHRSSKELLSALSNPLTEIAEANSEGNSGGGAWIVTEETDEITDQPNVTAMLDSSREFRDGFGNASTPALILRCRRDTTSAYFYLGNFEINDTMTAAYRLDGEPALTRSFETSSNNKAAGLWNGRNAIPFLNQIREAQKMLVRMQGRSDIYEMEYDLTGIAGVLEKVSKACNW